METFKTKLGTTRAGERTRIWIEGKRLVEHGFPVGTRILKTWYSDEGKLVLRIPVEPEDANATVSGKGEKPIIDITGKLVVSTFGDVSHVIVTYHKGRIVITKEEVDND
jgi:hypothetical protein